MALKRRTPERATHPEIMYVCEQCAEHCPEGCGHTDPADVRQAPDGRWLCENCWDEEMSESAPRFGDLQPAPNAYT